MNLSRLLCAGIATASLFAVVAQADARPRKRLYGKRAPVVYATGERAITVTRRSFLDSGTVVPVGSTNAYVQQIIRFERPPLADYSPGILYRPDPGKREPL